MSTTNVSEATNGVESLFEKEEIFLTIGGMRLRMSRPPVNDAKLMFHFALRDEVEVANVIAALPAEWKPLQKVGDKNACRREGCTDNHWSRDGTRTSSDYKEVSNTSRTRENGDKENTRVTIYRDEDRMMATRKDEGFRILLTLEDAHCGWQDRPTAHVELRDKKFQAEIQLVPRSKDVLETLLAFKEDPVKVTWCYRKGNESYSHAVEVCDPALS